MTDKMGTKQFTKGKQMWWVENREHALGKLAIMSKDGWVACAATMNVGLVKAEENAELICALVNAAQEIGNPMTVAQNLKELGRVSKVIASLGLNDTRKIMLQSVLSAIELDKGE